MEYSNDSSQFTSITEDIILNQELLWFRTLLNHRWQQYFEQTEHSEQKPELTPPPEIPLNAVSPYARQIQRHNLGLAERVALILALIPHLQPALLDLFFHKNAHYDRRFSEFGGYTPKGHSGFLPTGETLAFVLGADTPTDRCRRVYTLFDHCHPFHTARILTLTPAALGEPLLSGLLCPNQRLVEQCCFGHERAPQFSHQFPAQQLTSGLHWEALVLSSSAKRQLEDIVAWVQHRDTLYCDWEMAKKLHPGFRALFYGPSGTGKTLTVALLGQRVSMPVYRIDLSAIVSKYIGETEKNLARVFDLAENHDWILFFDEADALFGKRGKVSDARDRYANQEVSYLLQRIERFGGLTILASNMKENIDAAFIRRFDLSLYFAVPAAEQRLTLWRHGFSSRSTLAEDVDLTAIAQHYEMTGAMIINAIAYCSLQTIARGATEISRETLVAGIRREFHKSGRSI